MHGAGRQGQSSERNDTRSLHAQKLLLANICTVGASLLPTPPKQDHEQNLEALLIPSG